MNEVFYNSVDKTYYLSYLDKPSGFALELDSLFVSPENIGKSETAICTRDPWRCLILYGDHREQMLPIAGDMKALEKYWSDTPGKGDTSDDLNGDWIREEKVEARN